MSFALPSLDAEHPFRAIDALEAARNSEPSERARIRPPGQELEALRRAVPDFRATVIASGMPRSVATCPLVTLPYPTKMGLWRASRSPAPFLWITNRMLVVQWDEPTTSSESGERTTRTLLWEPSDHELGDRTPFFARLAKKMGPLPRQTFATEHGTVMGHLQVLGIAPEDVDYLVFDHLHTQDVRRLLGTRNPAPDLGSTDRPLQGWFPNAKLVTQVDEWEAIRHLHPVQAPWYQPETFTDLPPERIMGVDGDVLLGPGVALLSTPGHTIGNQSLVLHTSSGLWTSSENGLAAESWAPRASKIPGLAAYAGTSGHEVVMNANTIEFAAWQYNSMVIEAMVADRTNDGDFPQCFPSSELTGHRLSPMTHPTHVHGHITHGTVMASRATMRA